MKEMEEDFDALLDSFEADLKPTKTNLKDAELSADVDEILNLDDCDEEVKVRTTTSKRSKKPSKEESSRKCNPVLLAGSSSSAGLSTTLSPR